MALKFDATRWTLPHLPGITTPGIDWESLLIIYSVTYYYFAPKNIEFYTAR